LSAELKIEGLDLARIPEDIAQRIAEQAKLQKAIKLLQRKYDEEQARIASACSTVAPPEDVASTK